MACKVGLATRPVRVVILSIGLVFARGASLGHFSLLAASVYVMAVLTVITMLQRIWHVRGQLIAAPPPTTDPAPGVGQARARSRPPGTLAPMPAVTPPGALTGGRGARARIVVASLVLFREQGINATGVAELSAVAHVSKRTLYQHFPSKDDVTVAYLRAFELDPGLCAEGALIREDLTPRARLLELFTALA